MIKIDFDNINDSYLELFELIGRDAMLKLFTHNETDRREQAKIARVGGYSARVIEGLLRKRREENENEAE